MIQVTVHMKSGKSITVGHGKQDTVNTICAEYADWLGGLPSAAGYPMVNLVDVYGNRVVVPFSSIEYLEATR